MAQTHEQKFWNEVTASIHDEYRPYSAEYGVFLFREKLRRRGFGEEHATKLDPKLLARTVPWATFMTLGPAEYLMLRWFGRPAEAFSCFDERFQLHLGRIVPESQNTAGEVVLLTSVSTERFAQLELGQIELHDAFRHAETGHLLRFETAMALPNVVRCEDLKGLELPPMGKGFIEK